MENVFHIVSRTPHTRRAIVEALVDKGYQLMDGWDIERYANCIKRYPIILVRTLSYGTTTGIIDLAPFTSTLGKRVRSVNQIPDHGKIVVVNFKSQFKKVVLPKAAKYSLVYQKKDGGVEVYTISNPIEADANKFTCYCFGKGVKSFLKSNVRGLNKLSS